jgi:hypothetical protein
MSIGGSFSFQDFEDRSCHDEKDETRSSIVDAELNPKPTSAAVKALLLP